MATITLRDYLRELHLLLNREQYQEIVAHCHHILQHFPKNIETYQVLGTALLRNRSYAEAIEVFQRILSANPRDVTAFRGLSSAYERQGKLNQAIWYMERAFEIAPHDSRGAAEVQRLYMQRDGSSTAPPVQMTRAALAQQYLSGQLYDQAIQELREAVEQHPRRYDLKLMLAEALFSAQYTREAGELALEILQDLPDCLPAHVLMAQLWLSHKRPQDAQPYLHRVEDLAPYRSVALITEAQDEEQGVFLLPRFDYQASAAAALAVTPDWIDNLTMEDFAMADSAPASPAPSTSDAAAAPSMLDELAWLDEELDSEGEDSEDWYGDELALASPGTTRPLDDDPEAWFGMMDIDTDAEGSAAGEDVDTLFGEAALGDEPDLPDLDAVMGSSGEDADAEALEPGLLTDDELASFLDDDDLALDSGGAPDLEKAVSEAVEDQEAWLENLDSSADAAEDDWFAGLEDVTPTDGGEINESTAEIIASDDQDIPSAAATGEDWLASLGDSTEDEDLADLFEESAESGSDWFSNLESNSPAEGDNMAWADNEASEPTIKLFAVDDDAQSAAEDDFSAMFGEDTDADAPAEAAPTGVTDWLGGMDSLSEPDEAEEAWLTEGVEETPDWLAAAASPAQESESPAAEDDFSAMFGEAVDADAPAEAAPAAAEADWMSSFEESPAAEDDFSAMFGENADADTSAEAAPTGVTDWLGGMDSLSEPDADEEAWLTEGVEETPDWLAAAASPAQESESPAAEDDFSAMFGEDADADAPAEATPTGVTDWLGGMDSLSEPDEAEEAWLTEGVEETPDWLAAAASPAQESESPAAEDDFSAMFGEDADADAPAEADWMSSFEESESPAAEDDFSAMFGEDADADADVSAEAAPTGVTDWLGGMDSLSEPDVDEEAWLTEGVEETPDWLAAAASPAQESESPAAEDDFSAMFGEDADADVPAEATPAAAEADWMSSFEESPAAEDDFSAMFGEDADADAPTEAAPTTAEADWMSSFEESPAAEDDFSAMFGEDADADAPAEAAPTGATDWLDSLDRLSEPHEAEEAWLTEGVEETPDWLAAAASPAQESESPAAEDDFSAMFGEDADIEASVEPAAVGEEATPFDDLFADVQAPSNEAELAEQDLSPEWLSDMSGAESPAEAEEAVIARDVPDWLAQADASTADNSGEDSANLPDWMSAFNEDEEAEPVVEAEAESLGFEEAPEEPVEEPIAFAEPSEMFDNSVETAKELDDDDDFAFDFDFDFDFDKPPAWMRGREDSASSSFKPAWMRPASASPDEE